jgi:hypothetical protein
MNNVYLALLLFTTFMLGVLLGEGWAPISGLTPQALSARCASLEARAESLALRYEKLRALTTEVVVERDGGVRLKSR